MNDLTVFRFERGDVRAGSVDGIQVFVGKDVCEALGVAKYRDALAQLDLDERVSISADTLGGSQQMTAVTEAGIYSLALISRSARAKPFLRWLTHDVVPSIRTTGSYSVESTREIPRNYAEALRAAADEFEAHEETKAALDVAQPRADAWDAIASAAGDYSVGDAAKILARAGIPTGPTRLFGQLADLKWTYRGGDGAWRAYAERVEKGYLAEKPSFHYHPKSGERVVDPPQVRVTVRGIDRLRQRLHVGALAAVAS